MPLTDEQEHTLDLLAKASKDYELYLEIAGSGLRDLFAVDDSSRVPDAPSIDQLDIIIYPDPVGLTF